MSFLNRFGSRDRLLFVLALLLTIVLYWPGLSGGWLFDDYPNIISNHAVQPATLDFRSLVRAALSSPASEFKRPLASLSFVGNFALSGLEPWTWKVTNLAIHLLNGLLVFILARMLLNRAAPLTHAATREQTGVIAAFIAGTWMILPINLSAVLYIVQREESLANLFVLLGLIGYIACRTSMLAPTRPHIRGTRFRGGIFICALSLVVPTVLGTLAKETAVLLPLYALCAEWILFAFAPPPSPEDEDCRAPRRGDWRLGALFGLTLFLPAVIGVAWLLPTILNPASWATRDFTLASRLLTEGRVVLSYLFWTVLPNPEALSFYHDQYRVSDSLISPWTTLASLLALLLLALLAIRLRRNFPLVALGVMWFLSGQILTATILPLELVYEHRNYFASLGVMVAIVPLLSAPRATRSTDKSSPVSALPYAKLRHLLFGGLIVYWSALTLFTSHAWGDPLRQASDFAARAPDSPRAMYELGRIYIIYSNYNPNSPYRNLAYEVLEKAAALPQSSILPQQALIFMNARMHVPTEDRWWDSMIAKLKARKSTVQDESSLQELSSCQTNQECDLPKQRMVEAYIAALSHPNPSGRLLNMYGMYAWEVLGDRALAVRAQEDAVVASPREPAYRVTLIRMLTDTGRLEEARQALRKLQPLNLGGTMDEGIATLRARIDEAEKGNPHPSQSVGG